MLVLIYDYLLLIYLDIYFAKSRVHLVLSSKRKARVVIITTLFLSGGGQVIFDFNLASGLKKLKSELI